MPDEYDDLLNSLAAPKPSQPRRPRPTTSHLDVLTKFAQDNKLTVGSTTGGRHNRGSLHYSGNAIDIKGSGAFDDATVQRLAAEAKARGLKLRDERRRPAGQKVWGGPHVHVEYAGVGDDYDSLLDSIASPSTTQPQFPRGTSKGTASGPPELVRPRQQGQIESSGLGAPPLSRAAFKQADEEAVQQADANRRAVRAQVERERMTNAPTPARLFAKGMRMFGSQGVPVLTAARELTTSEGDLVSEEVEKRLAQQRLAETPEVVSGRKEFGAQAAPIRALTMPAGRTGAGIVRTLAGLSSFGGIAPNEASEYLNKRAAVLEQSASLAPLDEGGQEIERWKLEKAGGAVLDVGFTVAQLMAMKKATGLSLSKIMMLETALRTSDLPVKERAAQVAQAGVTGRALDVQMSRVGGAAANVVPTLAQEVPAVAVGQRDPYDAAINTAVQAGTGALLTSPRRRTPLQPMPQVTTREAAPTLRPSELSKRVALRGEVIDERIPSTRTVSNTESVTSQDRPIDTTRQVTDTSSLSQRESARPSTVRQPASEVVTPSARGMSRETQTETQPPVQARVAITEPVARPRAQDEAVADVVAPDTAVLATARRQQPPLEPVETEADALVAPRSRTQEMQGVEATTTPVKPQWQHRDFGRVQESDNQAGVGRGRVRVTAEDGSEHVIQRPKGTGAGNQIAIPVKETQQVSPTQDVPFMKRPRNEIGLNDIQQAEWDNVINNSDDYGGRKGVTEIIERSRLTREQKDALISRIPVVPPATEGGQKPPQGGEKQPWEMTFDEYARDRLIDPPYKVEGEGGMGFGLLNPRSAGYTALSDFGYTLKDFNTEADALKFLRDRYLPKKANEDLDSIHRNQVTYALNEGISVPPEVLRDYPDLQAKVATAPTTATIDGKSYSQRNGEWYRDADGKRVGGIVRDRLNAAVAPKTGEPQARPSSDRVAAEIERQMRMLGTDKPVDIDTLTNVLRIIEGWNIHDVTSGILQMEIDGRVRALPGREFMLKESATAPTKSALASRQGGPTEPAALPPAAVKPAQRSSQEAASQAETASPARDVGTAVPDWQPKEILVYRGGEFPESGEPWFTESRTEAAKYGEPKAYYLKVNRPTDVEGGFTPEWLREAGFDAARFPNPMSKEGRYGGQKPQWVPLSPEQIRPAEGAAKAASSPAPVESPIPSERIPPLTQVKSVKLPEQKPPPAPVEATKAPESSTTSARKAGMAADREALDLPTLPPAQRKSWRESLAEAKPESANRLADEVLANPRGLNDAETASVVVRAQQVKNEHAQKMAEIAAATDADTIARLRGETTALEAEFDKLTAATKASGTEKGRTLAAQKLTINQDFDLVSVKARMKAAKGRPLTEKEDARVEQMVKQVVELETKLAEANNRAQTAQLQRQIDRVKRQTKRGETKQVLDEEFAALKQQFAVAKIETRSGVQGSGLAALDPEGKLTVLIAKMARNRVKAGVVEAEKLVDEVYGAIKDKVEGLKREDVRDSILAYGFAEGRERTRQTQLLKTEADVSRRLEQRDFSRAERVPPVYTRETYALQKRVDELKAEFQRELYRAERGRGGLIYDTIIGATNVPKTGLTIGDLSAMLRQAGIGFYQHPALSARAAGDMFRSFTQHGFANVENAIKNHPDFQTLKRAGVEFTGVDKADPNLTKREEGYLGSDIIDAASKGKYNPLKYTVKPIKDFSERTFVSMLDSQRMRIGAHQLNALRGMNLGPKGLNDAIKAQAKYINIITGRGNLGRWGNQAAPFLNVFGFSPRLVVSRFQFLNKMFNPVAWANMPKGARRLQMADNAKFLFGVASSLALIKAAGDQYPQLGISVNMDSEDDADFLKVKVGNARYDFLTGLQQPMRFLLRMTIHGGDQWGGAMRGGETYTGAGADTIMADFLRSKSSPLVGYGWDALAGKNRLTGKKFEAGKDLARTVIPLPAQDFHEAVKQDGAVRGIVEALPSLFGVGVQTYPLSPEKPVTHAEKLARRIIRDKMPETARTEEEMEKSRKASDLRARSRKGEDVTVEIPPLNLTERQVKTIMEAKGVPRFQEDIKRLGVEDVLRVWQVATADERAIIKPLLADKADAVDQLDPSKQAAVKAQLRAAGIVPIEELPPEKQREIVAARRGERREQSRQRREKQRAQRQAGQRPSLGYGY